MDAALESVGKAAFPPPSGQNLRLDHCRGKAFANKALPLPRPVNISAASFGVLATWPFGTGMPHLLSSWTPWYSWIERLLFASCTKRCAACERGLDVNMRQLIWRRDIGAWVIACHSDRARISINLRVVLNRRHVCWLGRSRRQAISVLQLPLHPRNRRHPISL